MVSALSEVKDPRATRCAGKSSLISRVQIIRDRQSRVEDRRRTGYPWNNDKGISGTGKGRFTGKQEGFKYRCRLVGVAPVAESGKTGGGCDTWGVR